MPITLIFNNHDSNFILEYKCQCNLLLNIFHAANAFNTATNINAYNYEVCFNLFLKIT